jgi:hypothetical protein
MTPQLLEHDDVSLLARRFARTAGQVHLRDGQIRVSLSPSPHWFGSRSQYARNVLWLAVSGIMRALAAQAWRGDANPSRCHSRAWFAGDVPIASQNASSPFLPSPTSGVRFAASTQAWRALRCPGAVAGGASAVVVVAGSPAGGGSPVVVEGGRAAGVDVAAVVLGGTVTVAVLG